MHMLATIALIVGVPSFFTSSFASGNFAINLDLMTVYAFWARYVI